MKSKFDVSENEKNRIRKLVNEEKGLVTEAILESRKIEAKRCQEDGVSLAYIGGTVTHKKMTIDGDTPEVGDLFVNRESRNGNLTNDWSGNNPAGSDGKTYKVTKVFSLNDGCMFCLTYNFPSAPECDPGAPSPSWDCDGQGNCTDPGTGNGTYASSSSCQSNCIAPPPDSWDCDGQGNCTDPGDGSGQYSLLNPVWWQPGVPDCSSNCQPPPPDPSWDCDGQGNCSDPGTGNGQYSSLNDCNNNCVVPAYRCRDCNAPCSQQLIDAGECPYPTTAHCQAMCDDTNKWRCYRDKFGNKKCKKCKVYQMTDGTMCFNTKQECLDSECSELSLDDKSFETKGSSVQSDSPILSPSDDSPIAFGDGGSEELSKSRKINESDLRRIIRKITKGY